MCCNLTENVQRKNETKSLTEIMFEFKAAFFKRKKNCE